MPNLTINFSNRLITATCNKWNYPATINGLPNPQTPQQFVEAHIKKRYKDEGKDHEAATAAATAYNTAATDAETNM